MEKPMKTPTAGDLVDELGDLEVRLANMKLLAARAKMLRETIASWMGRRKPNATGTYDGARFVAQVGAAENKTQVTEIPALFEAIGKKQFLAHCSFTLKKLEDVVPLDDRPNYLTVTQDGARKVTVAPRPRKAKAG